MIITGIMNETRELRQRVLNFHMQRNSIIFYADLEECTKNGYVKLPNGPEKKILYARQGILCFDDNSCAVYETLQEKPNLISIVYSI